MPQVLAHVLSQLGKSVSHQLSIPELGRRSLDNVIIRYAAENNYFLLSRDFDMVEEDWFRADVKKHNAGIFFIRTAKVAGREMSLWDIARLTFKAWNNVEYHATSKSLPFVAIIKANGNVSTY